MVHTPNTPSPVVSLVVGGAQATSTALAGTHAQPKQHRDISDRER